MLIKSKGLKKPKRDRLEYEFLPEAIEIIETPPSKSSAILLWGIVAFLVITILWMYFAEVDMVSTARGKVVPDGRVKVIQPFEEGVIQAIYVTEGQSVKEGEVLLELDATLNDIDVQNIKHEINILKLEKEVLMGEESEGSKSGVNPKLKANIIEANDLNNQEYEVQQKAAALEVAQSKSQLAAEQNTLNSFKEDLKLLEQKEAEYKKLMNLGGTEKVTLEKLKLNLEILERENKEYKALYEADAITRAQWQELKDKLDLAQKEYETQKIKANEERIQMQIKSNEISQEQETTKAQIKDQESKIEKLKLTIETNELTEKMLENKKASTDITAVVEKDKQIAELEAQLNKMKKNQEYKTIVAPVDGVIQGLATNTLGGVVSPAETIMTVVPDDTPLVIEAYLPNQDIGFVEVGQEVSVKVDTFSYQKYGVLKGKIISISPDAIEDERMGYVYRMKVELEDLTINIDGKEMSLTPGMTVTAEVKTGKRKVLAFFLEPLIKYMDESITVR